MYILVTYDVETVTPAGQGRLRKVARACLDYGQRVQNSVFECQISAAQLVLLKERLGEIIDWNTDSIRFYHLGKNKTEPDDILGISKSFDLTAPLVI